MIKNVSVGAAKKKTMAFNVILVHFSIDFGGRTYDMCKFMVVTATRRKNSQFHPWDGICEPMKCSAENLGTDFRRVIFAFGLRFGKSLLEVFPLRKILYKRWF